MENGCRAYWTKGRQDHLMSDEFPRRGLARILVLLLIFVLASLPLSGCDDDDNCVTCLEGGDVLVEVGPPVVPTGVHSISQDNLVVVQWYDISYYPYDGQYNPNVVAYRIYSRYFQDGDENDPYREFYYLAEVAWDENFDFTTGLHWFDDDEAVNGERYEYAVSAVNVVDQESALSYEFVTDAPLPMSVVPVELFFADGLQGHLAGFDFSLLGAGRVDPAEPTTADIRIVQIDGIPYVEAVRAAVHLQDFGVFTDGAGDLVFEGVSWAPADGYSSSGRLEIIRGHIYVVEIVDFQAAKVNYAKFGVVETGPFSILIHWAYQTIAGLPELIVDEGSRPVSVQSTIIDL